MPSKKIDTIAKDAQQQAVDQYNETFGSKKVTIGKNKTIKKLAQVDATALTKSFNDRHLTKITTLVRDNDIFENGVCINDTRPNRDLDSIDFTKTLSMYLADSTCNIDKALDNMQLKMILGRLISGGTPYIIGIPGTGKTWMVQNYFKALIEYLFSDVLDGIVDVNVIIINASASVPQDITGEQVVDFASGGEFSRYIIGDTMKEVIVNNNTISIIFLDEVNRAQPDMIATCMKLIDGELNPNFKMPVNSLVIAAGNLGEEDGTDCISFEELDSAIKDRFGVPVLYAPDFATWLLINTHGAGIDPELIDLIRTNQSDVKELFFGTTVESRIATPRRLTAFARELTVQKKLLNINELNQYIDIYFFKGHIDHVYTKIAKKNSNDVTYSLRDNRYMKIDQSLQRFVNTLKAHVSSTSAKLSLHDPNTFIDHGKSISILKKLKDSDINHIGNAFEIACRTNNAQSQGLLRKYMNAKYKANQDISMGEKTYGLISDYATGLYLAYLEHPTFANTYLKAASNVFTNCVGFEDSKLKSQIFNANIQSKEDLSFDKILESISEQKFLDDLIKHVPTVMFVALMTVLDKINAQDASKTAFIEQINQKVLATIYEEYDRIS